MFQSLLVLSKWIEGMFSDQTANIRLHLGTEWKKHLFQLTWKASNVKRNRYLPILGSMRGPDS